MTTTLAMLGVTMLAFGCASQHRDFTDEEWTQLASLANLSDPPLDTSNKYIGDPKVIALGKKFYFDPDFSGEATQLDMLNRPALAARAQLGKPLGISCNTCHQVDVAGGDHTSVPNNVGVGAGAYDVNGQQTMNAAYYKLLYWNGRADSLWSQIVAVAENDVSMASDRLKIVWRIADAYRDEYNAAFGEWPMPALIDNVAMQKNRLLGDGTCVLSEGSCPGWCTQVSVGPTSWCLPRFPLRGKPGYENQVGLVDDGTFRGCQRGQPQSNPRAQPEPFNDAFDCMRIDDQRAVTRIYTNWAKAIAAYEYTLISRDAPFDQWVNDGAESDHISAAAKRGAKLFVGKAACIDCHNSALFSDDQFHNIGVPQSGAFVPTVNDCPAGGWCDCVSSDVNQPMNCMPNGARDGLRRLQSSRYRRDSFYSDDAQCQNNFLAHNDARMTNPDDCDGLASFYSVLRPDSLLDATTLLGQWRTPSLRDVALTAPYMHTGAYETLEDVVAHYNNGGAAGRGNFVGTRDPRIAPLKLSTAEVSDLVAFLRTLNGARLPEAVIATPTLPAPSPF